MKATKNWHPETIKHRVFFKFVSRSPDVTSELPLGVSYGFLVKPQDG